MHPGVGPRLAQTVERFGVTGALARRKRLPGLLHLSSAGLIPGGRIFDASLDDVDVGAASRLHAAPLASSPAARCPTPTGKPSWQASTACRWPQASPRCRPRSSWPSRASAPKPAAALPDRRARDLGPGHALGRLRADRRRPAKNGNRCFATGCGPSRATCCAVSTLATGRKEAWASNRTPRASLPWGVPVANPARRRSRR